ncbi:MAG: DoxX family protein [Flavobacteriaceae bacterium]
MNTNQIIYWVATGLLSVLMLFSAGMYFFKHGMVRETFMDLGYPTYIIYPLAILKIAGLVVIWSKKFKALKEWAYAGFFFDFVLALAAHLMVNDGEYLPALLAMVLLMVSYGYGKKMA